MKRENKIKSTVNDLDIKNDATYGKKLWNLWQRATGNSGSSDQVETIFTGHIGNIWNMDGLWKHEVFLRISQVEWKTSKMVSEVVRL